MVARDQARQRMNLMSAAGLAPESIGGELPFRRVRRARQRSWIRSRYSRERIEIWNLTGTTQTPGRAVRAG